MNKLEVNAALWNLVNGEDIEASSKTVIEFALTLKDPSPISIEISKVSNKSDSITGQTSHGNVVITDDNKKKWEYSYGGTKTRIGHFKVWRDEDQIWFHHFWKSEEETAGGRSEIDKYRLRYNEQSLELEHFGIITEVEVFSFWIFHITAEFSEPIWGSEKEYICKSFGIVL